MEVVKVAMDRQILRQWEGDKSLVKSVCHSEDVGHGGIYPVKTGSHQIDPSFASAPCSGSFGGLEFFSNRKFASPLSLGFSGPLHPPPPLSLYFFGATGSCSYPGRQAACSFCNLPLLLASACRKSLLPPNRCSLLSTPATASSQAAAFLSQPTATSCRRFLPQLAAAPCHYCLAPCRKTLLLPYLLQQFLVTANRSILSPLLATLFGGTGAALFATGELTSIMRSTFTLTYVIGIRLYLKREIPSRLPATPGKRDPGRRAEITESSAENQFLPVTKAGVNCSCSNVTSTSILIMGTPKSKTIPNFVVTPFSHETLISNLFSHATNSIARLVSSSSRTTIHIFTITFYTSN
ncbi:hypothetical protein KSP40_PGU010398 [Platanthera guangdongensis]|uniref:Uncharacterized protein n=1 Tax=Platanthera guangdongensis TaxID=2320717 RepID=A0ABR2MUG6_9ASPA